MLLFSFINIIVLPCLPEFKFLRKNSPASEEALFIYERVDPLTRSECAHLKANVCDLTDGFGTKSDYTSVVPRFGPLTPLSLNL